MSKWIRQPMLIGGLIQILSMAIIHLSVSYTVFTGFISSVAFAFNPVSSGALAVSILLDYRLVRRNKSTQLFIPLSTLFALLVLSIAGSSYTTHFIFVLPITLLVYCILCGLLLRELPIGKFKRWILAVGLLCKALVVYFIWLTLLFFTVGIEIPS